MSLLFYVTHEGESHFQPVIQKNVLTALHGNTPELGGGKTFTSFHNAMWTWSNQNKDGLLLISDMINLHQESLESERMQYVLPDGSILEVS